jgi:hypothetical protein
VDWDKELNALAKPTNPFYKELRDMKPDKLVAEFAAAAPEEVQFAVKATVASLIGNMPDVVGESSVTTTGRNLASLMFNMQMTGYMFKNAEYRKGIVSSLRASEAEDGNGGGLTIANDPQSIALPPVSGKITVEIAPGMSAEVDAAAYMAELRNEVEGLRAELVRVQEEKALARSDEPPTGLIQYIQSLAGEDQKELTATVSPEVLEAMSQLVSSLLFDLNIERDMQMAAPASKLRELLIVQLVNGYRLREMEIKDELKQKFWGL